MRIPTTCVEALKLAIERIVMGGHDTTGIDKTIILGASCAYAQVIRIIALKLPNHGNVVTLDHTTSGIDISLSEQLVQVVGCRRFRRLCLVIVSFSLVQFPTA